MEPKKKVIFTIGGKGGTGKTTLMTALAEWFAANNIPCALLDLDTENKSKGSLVHFFSGEARKVDIHRSAGLDIFVDTEADIILADMGAGSGRASYEWFDDMEGSIDSLLTFTAIGLITSDPASVESVLTWANQLQDRVSYLIALNKYKDADADFTYWEHTKEATQFRDIFHPAVMTMDYRISELQNAVRNHGMTLTAVTQRERDIPELRRTSLVIRAQSYRRKLFAEFDSVREVLLP